MMGDILSSALHSSPFSALASLSGPNAVVKNQAGANLLADGSTSGSAPVSVTFSAPAEADLAQTSGFVWTNVMQHFAAGKIGTNVSLARLVVNVNIDETCNANFNQVDISLNFFKSGDNCANTAYSDVIMHEFGHAIDDSNGGILDNAYSEGFGDAMALLVSQQPCVGRDFNGLGTCLRNSSEVVAWPAPAGDDPHDVRRRYSGFVWELVQQLRQSSNPIESAAAWNTAKNLVLGASVMNPSDIPDAVKLSFVADGWVSPTSFCSPHFKELAAAADSRAIPRPTTCTPLNCAAIKLELTSLQKQLSAAEQRRGTSVCAGPASLECEMAVKNIQTQINTENSIFREYCSTQRGAAKTAEYFASMGLGPVAVTGGVTITPHFFATVEAQGSFRESRCHGRHAVRFATVFAGSARMRHRSSPGISRWSPTADEPGH